MSESIDQIIEITELAKTKIEEIVKKDPQEGKALRFGVIGGGCSGLSYKMEFSEKKESDNTIALGFIDVVIDPKSSIYLKGTTIDFQDGLQGKGFIFVNPNASNTCGCGESFSM
jgi:iron-sulfur cluster assembly protein